MQEAALMFADEAIALLEAASPAMVKRMDVEEVSETLGRKSAEFDLGDDSVLIVTVYRKKK